MAGPEVFVSVLGNCHVGTVFQFHGDFQTILLGGLFFYRRAGDTASDGAEDCGAMAGRMNRDLVFDHAEATQALDFAPRAFVLTCDDLPG